jgi:hypothetical protein
MSTITKKFPYVICSREEGGDIIYAEFPDPIRVDLAIARELVANRLSFSKNQAHYYILDLSNVKEITTEAKDFMQSPEGGLKNILGGALIATNPVSKLIANIFTKTRKDFRAQVFSNKIEAFRWITEEKEKIAH